MRPRHLALPLLLLLAACASGGPTTDPIHEGLRLQAMNAERETIAAAALAAYTSRAIGDPEGPDIAKAGLVTGLAIDAARAALDANWRDRPLKALVTGADVAMVALRTLARNAGVQWETTP